MESRFDPAVAAAIEQSTVDIRRDGPRWLESSASIAHALESKDDPVVGDSARQSSRCQVSDSGLETYGCRASRPSEEIGFLTEAKCDSPFNVD